jgi:hypothetical protein
MKTKSKQTALVYPCRGSLVSFRVDDGIKTSSTKLGIVVSNDTQNQFSDSIIIAPLELRKSRLKAPFAVDLSRNDGFRKLHCCRCDQLQSVHRNNIIAIERSLYPGELLIKLNEALACSLSLF